MCIPVTQEKEFIFLFVKFFQELKIVFSSNGFRYSSQLSQLHVVFFIILYE